MAKMKDIAELAGVNVTTVSKALRGSSDISKETSARIWTLAQQLGYQPKHMKEKSEPHIVRIGVVCPAAGGMMNLIFNSLHDANYEMVAVVSHFDAEFERKMIRELADDVDGIIYLNSMGEPLENVYIHKPIIVVGPKFRCDYYDWLSVDEASGYRQAIDHLSSLGHRRFGFIGDRFFKPRLSLVQEQIARCGLELRDEHIVIDHERRHLKCGYHAVERLTRLGNDMPTAFIAQYDDVAFGAIERMRELGIRVPEDVSVIGFDDMDYCKHFRPKLSSICSHEDKVAEIATGIMKKKIRDPLYGAIQTVEVKTTYTPRESTGIPRAE